MVDPKTPWTPGPWIVNPFHAQVDCGIASEKGGLLPIAQMLWPTFERSEQETWANARLIAVAPEMAGALRNAEACLKHCAITDADREVLGSIRAILAKIGGDA